MFPEAFIELTLGLFDLLKVAFFTFSQVYDACGFLFNFSKVTENAIITIKLLIFFPHLQ